ncbi:hypothetical protein AXX17_AT4G04170 [Arabidopsis thaliana]|uniref:Ubiquitin-like domain-containing protein n=1 Tax=Arabidopsis thaliana TaxID=3702 RepID=A0A178V250_ARATH|nr:hypothetical protein AXX17_AT4G04170 [Arabidopsis thaliana]
MKMTVENESGSTFSIDIGLQDTVLTFKRKIEMTQRIPVSRQTIFFQGKLLEDHLDIFEWDILQNPLLHLSISPDENPTQNQVPQSPSNPIPEFVKNQDSAEDKKNPVLLHQTGKPPLPPKSSPLTTENFSKNQHDRPVITKVVPELLGPQGTSPVTVGRRRNRDQEVQNRVSSSSDSVKEVINIPDTPARKKTKNYPLKITVMVQPFKETRRIQVEVNVLSNVEVLRKELVKMQERGELNLPHEGFFFIHKQDVLREDQSFMANRVAPVSINLETLLNTIVKLFVENQSGSSFEIEVDHKDTVLELKQKIEKSQCIPVSPDQNPNHNQTEQSPPPSNSTEQIIDGHQDSTVIGQTEQSPPPSNPTEQIINAHQDSTVTAQTEQSPSSNSVQEMITNIQGLSEKERIPKKPIVICVLPYSGESEAAKGIPVAVNVKMNDNVKELRNELVKIAENGELNLPQEQSI